MTFRYQGDVLLSIKITSSLAGNLRRKKENQHSIQNPYWSDSKGLHSINAYTYLTPEGPWNREYFSSKSSADSSVIVTFWYLACNLLRNFLTCLWWSVFTCELAAKSKNPSMIFIGRQACFRRGPHHCTRRNTWMRHFASVMMKKRRKRKYNIWNAEKQREQKEI